MIQTKRLLLSPLSDEALQALQDAETDPEMIKAYGEMLSGCLSHPTDRLWYTAWSMEKDGEVIGDLCFKGSPDDGFVEIGYGVYPPFEGRGYATEAAKGAIKWAFSHQKVEGVFGETNPDNAASQRVLEKLGFAPCGMGEEGPRFLLRREVYEALD